MSNARGRVEALHLGMLYRADVVGLPLYAKKEECPIWGSEPLPRYINPTEALTFDWPSSYTPNVGQNLGGVFDVTYSWTDDGPSETVLAFVSQCHHEPRTGRRRPE